LLAIFKFPFKVNGVSLGADAEKQLKEKAGYDIFHCYLQQFSTVG
jgi:hypothetical protein